MKKILFSLVCFLAFTFAMTAQSNSATSGMNDMQKQQFEQIQKSHETQMQAIINLQKTDPQKFQTKRDAILQDTDRKMKAVMTEAQWKNYQRFIQQRDQMLQLQKKGNN